MPPREAIDAWMARQGWPDLRTFLDDAPSYLHPYGFLVFRLPLDAFPEWGIRVHLWPPPGQRRTDSDPFIVHSHGWDLLTRSVVGCVRHAMYDVDDGATAVSYDLFTVDSSPGTGFSVLSPEGRSTSVRMVSEWDATPQESPLYIPAGRFHTTTGPHEAVWDSWSVTLVATEHVTGNDSKVLGPSNSGAVVNERAAITDPNVPLSAVDHVYEQRVNGSNRWTSFVFLIDSGRILLARTHRYPGYWHPVGGQMESWDDTPLDTARREVREEVGIDLNASEMISLGCLPRDEGPGKIHAWVCVGDFPSRPDVQEAEIHAIRWTTLEEALRLDSLAASHIFLTTISDRRREFGLEI
ncbi:NUDIX hydrolase [Streptomyces nigra]|uniref:NUDIX hydrolase n=1 Tax=Streptomyces nigra TaxID=1827580 RepID=UPI00369BE523